MGQIRDLLESMLYTIDSNKDVLNNLDRAIGDGDHGNNLLVGLNASIDYIEELGNDKNPQLVLKTISEAFGENVGGAAGPIYAIGLKYASDACSVDTPFNLKVLIECIKAALEGIAKRGKVKENEKTLYDVLYGVYNSLMESEKSGKTLNQALSTIVSVAKHTVDYTKDITAKKGKAAYYGKRSVGHIDPGSMGLYLLIKVFVSFYKN